MVDTNVEPDLEKCSPSIIYSARRKNKRPPSREKRKKIDEERPHAFACEDRENIDGERPSASWRNVRLKAYGQAKPDGVDKARQCCFLCLRGQNGSYAIQVPCRRPEIEKEEPLPFAFMVKPEKVDPTENASESDAVIWNRMLDMYYKMGNWKRWLPFYGPVSVQEVEFEFVRAKDQNGLYEICHVIPVDIERVEKEADCIIETKEACLFNAQFTGEYCWDSLHPQECPASLPEFFFGPQTCILHQAAEANRRKRKLKRLYLLKECARSPQKANGQETLDGMAQDSCIYNTKEVIVPQRGKPYKGDEKIRGIEMIMGWQMDRIYLYGPKALAWSALGMAIISICIVAWGEQSKDWGNAMAFGQLLAAFLAIIISSVRD